MQQHENVMGRMKLVIFELLYVIESNKFKNKYILGIVQILQLLPVVYYYINPLFRQLSNMHVFGQFHNKIWPQIVLFIPNQQAIVSIILLLSFPSILLALLLMKIFIGYQYILIVVIQLFMLLYPVVFVKFTLDAIDLLIHKPQYTAIAILLSLIHIIGSLAAFQLYHKKHKIVDTLLILLLFLNINQYAILALLILRLGFIYLVSAQTIVKQLKINIQLSLLIILCFSFFTSDVVTNYISFIFILMAFSVSPIISILQQYDLYQNLMPQHHDNIFYQLNQVEDQPTIFKTIFYDFLQQHLKQCLNVNCSCRKLLIIKDTQQFKQQSYKLLNTIYSFKQNFQSTIQYAQICSTHFSYKLSGLFHTFQHTAQNLYQQYQSFYLVTYYQQEYRRGDKNYHFGQKYHTIYEDLGQFQQKIEKITVILRQFWLTILEFDGSRKFLSMILSISQQINQITTLFNLYIDKYEEHSHYFLYLYKTFQLVILNSHQNNQEFQQTSFKSLGSLKSQQKIKVPERMLFFVADQQTHIINCNRQFSNFVEIDRQQLVNKTYNIFVPKYCQQQHNLWVQNWFHNCNKQEEFTQTIKTIQFQNTYIKSVKILTKILPRFNHQLQTITFIKPIHQLTLSNHTNHNPSITQSVTSQNKKQQEEEDFFSFLIQKQSMKITGIDQSFFYVIKINQSQQLKKKMLSLKLNEIFPKFNIYLNKQTKKDTYKQKQSQQDKQKQHDLLKRQKQHDLLRKQNQNDHFNKQKQVKNTKQIEQSVPKQVILNYSVLQQFIELKQNKNVYGLQEINKQNSYLKGVNIKQTTQHTFLYEIIEQNNTNLQTQYCIVHFKHKNKGSHNLKQLHKINSKILSNTNGNIDTRKQNERFIIQSNKQNQNQKQRENFKDGIKQDEQNDQIQQGMKKKRRTSKNSERSRKSTMLQNNQIGASVIANLAYRQPFIRSSKPYKGQSSIKDGQTQKQQSINEQVQLSLEKSYCLPWPIIFPLIIVHILYTYVIQQHSSILQYLSQSFQFYDKYEMTILRELNVIIGNNVNYLQQLKQLWIQGYGFYQDSFLLFQNHTINDQYLKDRLYSTLIQHNHYGIYQQISQSFYNQQSIVTTFHLTIILTLSGFILYILIDFILNLKYCFSISSKVTDIILIFLNISQKDIKKLIISIDQYQQNVLQINDFNMIKNIIKRQQDSYHIDQRQVQENSVIGLLKVNNKSPSNLIQQSKVKNLDSLYNSPLKSEDSKIKTNQFYIDNQKVPIIISKDNQKQKRKTMLRKRKTTRLQKINIDKLKQSIGFLQQSQNQSDIISPVGSEKFILTKKSSFINEQTKKSSFVKDSQSNKLSHFSQFYSNSLKVNTIIKTKQQNEQDLNEQKLQKMQKISKFKDKFRGRLNDIRQHSYLYGMLLLVAVIGVIVLIVVIVIVPQFVSTFKTFQQRYFDLRVMKIVIFKQLIQKITNFTLQPYIKPSIKSQQFYTNMQDTLDNLPKFQQFWSNVYSYDACPLVSDQDIKSMCISIGSNTTAYGQKIMLQFLQDLLRRLNSTQLFTQPSLSNTTQFIKVVNLQLYMISQGQKLMKQQIHSYQQSVKNIQITLIIVGTIFLTFCIILSRKALNGILSKIKDGENLLLVMPQHIKNKYIDEVKKNKSIQQIKQLQKEQKQKKRKTRRKSSIVKPPSQSKFLSQQPQYSKTPQQEPQQSALQLIVNNSSLLNKDQENLLKQNLKNHPQLKLNSVIKNNKNITNKSPYNKSKFSY